MMGLLVKDLGVTLGGKTLLGDVGFEARAGEFLAIVGPNGAGKTTLLKAIAGLLSYRGQVAWQGEDLASATVSARARLISYLPQGHTIHWPITAREAVTIGRAPHSSSLTRLSPEDNMAIDQAIDAVDAGAFAHRPVTELSGGEKARIMLARALAVNAPMLLADEPVAALDPAHQLSVMRVLGEQARHGRLIICISHDLLLASRFADRFLVLDKGQIAAIGSYADALTQEIYARVFGVTTRRFESEGETVTMPWASV
ncbi:MAG: ABC transporter ATP-binding protein [Hyphomicrobiales bacterium]|nr:ABC transporter ATP-binding protein [Hyphomicrobiales bacterium]